MANNCANYIKVAGIDHDVELFLSKFNNELDWLVDLHIDKEENTISFTTKWFPEIARVKDMATGGTLYLQYFYDELSSYIYGVAIMEPEGECRIIELTEKEVKQYTDEQEDNDYEGLDQLLKSKI